MMFQLYNFGVTMSHFHTRLLISDKDSRSRIGMVGGLQMSLLIVFKHANKMRKIVSLPLDFEAFKGMTSCVPLHVCPKFIRCSCVIESPCYGSLLQVNVSLFTWRRLPKRGLPNMISALEGNLSIPTGRCDFGHCDS